MTMISYGLCCALVVVIVQTCTVYGQEDIIKGSLTFVIDHTYSMHDEISQVKEEVIIIFEKVFSSKASQIENFVLVTFNDPGADVRTITKDPNEFKRAVANIQLLGNWDCPEYAMKGIELGLRESLPLSYLYVFTDASAKDYNRYEEIKSIAQKKQIQIVFMLTGECTTRSGPDYEVYHKIAEATAGQVFHMMKDDVKDILKYIEESITGRGITLVNTKLPPGYGNKITYPVDAHTGEVLISVTGKDPRIGAVTGPGGSKPTTESVVSGKREMAVVKVMNAKPGDHEVEVGSSSDTHAVVTAKSDLNFQLGFSIDRPDSMKDTATRPAPEGTAFLGIKLLGSGVKLTTVKILDLSDTVVTELPLELVDEKQQFYVTPSFNPPFNTFRVSVIGKDLKTETPIERKGPTPIARQDPSAEKKENKAPVITIEGAPKIITEYDAPLKLKCKVHGYPAPDIIWEEKETGIRMPAKVQLIEVPYDYVGILDIDKAIKNVTYQCKASNFVGTTIQYVQVETERKIYFDVIEAPTDIRVEYDKEGTLVCKVDAYPPASITWYKDGAVLSGNTNIDFSSNKSILTIKHMQLELQGKYTCEARNDLELKDFIANVVIFGVEAPVIDKSHEEIRVLEKTNSALSCSILKGIPKPAISWSFRPAGVDTFKVMKETAETVNLNNVRKDQTGSYKCNAQNALGSDSFTMELVVEFPVTIETPKTSVIETVVGKSEILYCRADGYPKPNIKWTFQSSDPKIPVKDITPTGDVASVALKNAQLDQQGLYTCEAENGIGGPAHITYDVKVYEAPVIDKSHEEIRVIEKTDAALSCRILKGNPRPAVSWSFQPAGMAKFRVMKETAETIHLNNVRREQTGSYKCNAQNVLGSDSFTMELVVEFPVTIETPKTSVIETVVGKSEILYCRADGYPKPNIKWTFQSSDPKIPVKDITPTGDVASVALKNAQLDQQGLYTCEAENGIGGPAHITYDVKVYEAPVIDKSHEEIRVIEKKNTALSCRILKGNPKPAVSWSFQPAGMAKFKVMKETAETVHLNNVRKEQTGSYKCNAQNVLGSDSFTMELVVEFPVTIETPKKSIIETVVGKSEILYCRADGYPKPNIKWTFQSSDPKIPVKDITPTGDVASVALKNAQLDQQGLYTCEAENGIGGPAHITYDVKVYEAPVIDKSHEEIRVIEKKNTALSCRILKGNPKPAVSWSFRPAGVNKFRVMKETAETVHLNNVRKEQTGSYKCNAQNVLGSDSFTMELVVEYPPTIKEDAKLLQIKDDDEVTISCDVTGEPAPEVRWLFNGTKLDSTTKTRVSSDNSLRFEARIDDIGSYRCEAVNKLGSAQKTAFLDVFVPVTIETPKKSMIEIMVGKSTILYCRADGYPIPNIKWTFQSSEPKMPVKDITPTGDVASVALKNAQLDQQGLYTCEAENGIGGSAHITYDVKVYAPPVIQNVYLTKIFEAVEGDMAVRIQCKATGSPTPTIVWMKNGLNLAIGSEWYEMEDDGTLIIKNIDRDSNGMYVCVAENVFGKDTEVYEVIVRDNLIPEIPTNTVFVEEGKTIDIKCDIPHMITDQIRWFKGGVPIASEELTLYSVTRSDDGLYTCRVSNPAKTRSVTTKVVIGFKPVFTTTEEKIVEFVHEADSKILSCEAYGQPRPTSAVWKHNGKELSTTAMSHPLGMVYGATGTYECEVSNKFGSIHRTFNVTSRDCILNIQKDFPEKQPIMYSPALGWSVFPVNNGYMTIPHDDYFFLNCPSRFSNPNLPATSMAFCERDSTIKINGKRYNFPDIQCNEEVKPQVSETGIPCLPGNTESIKIGYKVFTEFLGVYEVCLDKENNVPLFTKHKLSPHHTDRSTEAEWSNNLLPQDFDTLYDCRRQMYDISTTLGRGLRTRDSCCFGKRQLVNSHNLLPGIPTSAAYEYLNVIPHWSTCNSKNWEDVEQSVRNLVKSAGRDLMIMTGTAHHSGLSTDMTLHDGRGGKQTVAPYLWKVVQDPAQSASLAIIQVNIPELSPDEASKYVLCPDICANGISWIEPSNWHNVEDGYTYCCAITEFEKAFGYNGRFSPGLFYVLFDGDLVPDIYTTK